MSPVLLSNAVTFTSDGSVTVSANAVGDQRVLTVEDTGIDMNEEEGAVLGARLTAAQGPGGRGAHGAGRGRGRRCGVSGDAAPE